MSGRRVAVATKVLTASDRVVDKIEQERRRVTARQCQDASLKNASTLQDNRAVTFSSLFDS